MSIISRLTCVASYTPTLRDFQSMVYYLNEPMLKNRLYQEFSRASKDLEQTQYAYSQKCKDLRFSRLTTEQKDDVTKKIATLAAHFDAISDLSATLSKKLKTLCYGK